MQLRYPLFFVALVSFLGLTACATAPQNNQPEMLFNHPGRIKLQVLAKNPDDLPPGIEQVVAKNLSDWNYPMGVKNGVEFSHNIVATVGILTHGAMPTGFSFTIGNSDPHSPEFQQADTLPVSCVLSSIKHPEQSRELSMDFIADRSDKAYLAVDKLADHISTVCFNTLTEAKWPLSSENELPANTFKSSSWIPEIRIEEKLTTDSPTTIPTIPPADKSLPASDTDKIVSQPAATPPVKAEKPKVSIESNKPRRQIIIHNQGAPVILEFGYERR